MEIRPLFGSTFVVPKKHSPTLIDVLHPYLGNTAFQVIDSYERNHQLVDYATIGSTLDIFVINDLKKKNIPFDVYKLDNRVSVFQPGKDGKSVKTWDYFKNQP